MTDHETRAKAFRDCYEGLAHVSKEKLLAELSWLTKNPPEELTAGQTGDGRAVNEKYAWRCALASIRALLEEPEGGEK